MRKLPPLKALQCFEATARLGTVRKAASDLYVTPSAISHQIAKLEEWLGKPLFHRQQRRLFLTDAGGKFLQQIEQAFDQLEDAALDMIDRREAEKLSVAMPPSFMALWLMPNLEKFRNRCPDIDLHFVDRLTLDDYEDRVDCGIEYRLSASSDLYTEKLYEEEIVPLASPALCRREGIFDLDSLQGQTLIMTELRLTSWRTLLSDKAWFKECPVISVRYSYQAFNAAAHGLGIALGNRQNAEDLILRGQLEIPFSIQRDKLPTAPQYFFSCREKNRSLPKVQAFLGWLREAIDETKGGV